MLLALDENNHRHGGASAAQINALPESTVQVLLEPTYPKILILEKY